MTPVRIFGLLFIFASYWACTPKVDEVVAPTEPNTQVFQIPDAGIYPLENQQHLEVLLKEIGSASLVLLGGASHGTAEFLSWWAGITSSPGTGAGPPASAIWWRAAQMWGSSQQTGAAAGMAQKRRLDQAPGPPRY